MFSQNKCKAPIVQNFSDKRILTGLNTVNLEDMNNDEILLIVNINDRIFTPDQVIIFFEDERCEIKPQPSESKTNQEQASVLIDGEIYKGNVIVIQLNKQKDYDLFIDGAQKLTFSNNPPGKKMYSSQSAAPPTPDKADINQPIDLYRKPHGITMFRPYANPLTAPNSILNFKPDTDTAPELAFKCCTIL